MFHLSQLQNITISIHIVIIYITIFKNFECSRILKSLELLQVMSKYFFKLKKFLLITCNSYDCMDITLVKYCVLITN